MAMSKMSHLLFKQNSQQPKQFRGGEKKVMKKSLSLLLAITLVVSMFASVVSAADKSAGETLKEKGIITGTSEGLQESAQWLRKDVTILLSRLSGVEAEAKAHANTHGFTDLNAKGYNGYVSWAKEEGLFKGATETTFAPNDAITNYQFAAVILRVLGQEQEKYEDNLAKAIELKLFAEGTNGSDKAVRGSIYEAVAAALDVEVDGQKLGTKLGVKGYEIVDLAVKSATAVVSKTVTVNFNEELATVNAADVTVKDAEGNGVLVEKVEVKGSVATVTLATALTSGKEYTVAIAKATGTKAAALENGSATFTYVKAAPASVAFEATTVAVGSTVKYIVKDANGNDVTADYPVSDFNVKSTVNGVVADDSATEPLKALSVNFSSVNVTLKADDKVTTGNVTITVVNALSIEIKEAKSGFDKDVVFLGANSAPTSGTVVKTVINKSNNDADITSSATFKYASSNPSVVVVTDTGAYTAIQEGSATISVSATYEGKTVTKSFVVTVKKERKATSFSVDKPAVTVVNNGQNIPQTVTVTVLDQYGNGIAGQTVNAVVVTSGAGIASVTTPSTTNNDGKSTFNVVAGTTNGSTSIDVTVTGINNSTQKVNVSTVAAGNVSSYEVVTSATKLDSNSTGTVAAGKTANAASALVSVYVKDVNGNRINEVASGFTVESTTNNGNITISGATVLPVADKNGNDTVKVVLNGVTIGTITFDVAPTSPTYASSVSAAKTAITVAKSASITSALFGSNGVFVATNPYGETFKVSDAQNQNITIYSSNTSVVSVSGATASATATAGTSILTVVINGAVFTVTVNVQ